MDETLQKWTKGDVITPYKSRPLNEGNPIKRETRRLRAAKLRVVNGLKDAGFEEEAVDLNDSYKVGDYSVVFYQCLSQFRWILDEEE